MASAEDVTPMPPIADVRALGSMSVNCPTVVPVLVWEERLHQPRRSAATRIVVRLILLPHDRKLANVRIEAAGLDVEKKQSGSDVKIVLRPEVPRNHGIRRSV